MQQADRSPLVLKVLWYHLDSNQGHMDFQSIALPPELWYQLGAQM